MAISFSRQHPESSSDPFRVVRRGFDPDEVRAYIAQFSAEVQQLRDQLAAVESALADAQRPTYDLNDLTPEVLLDLVGEESVRRLDAARDDASRAVRAAEDEAVRIVAEAYEEAARVREAVQQEVVYLQRTTAEQMEAELASARGRGLDMVTEAREYREKVLADLAERRELARQQIRALLDGRDHLLRADRKSTRLNSSHT